MATGDRVTIRDVAREARVSIATVSRVLNGDGKVNETMAAKVTEAAQRLGYSPNTAARGLVSGAFSTVGVVVPDLGNPYFSEILKSTVSAAKADGYRIVVMDTWGDPAEELAACRQQLPNVDGLILLSPRMPTQDLKSLAESGRPMVMVNREDTGVDLPTVTSDNYNAISELCRHLHSLGHSRIVYLSGSPLAWQNQERWRGIQESAAELGLEAVSVHCEPTIAGGYAVADEAVDSAPTAILGFNDLSAFGAVTRLRELGLEVPVDVSVTGFDDIELARHIRPTLTTAISPKRQLGQRSWHVIRAALTGGPVPDPKPVSTQVVIRQSTGLAPRRV